ncbi:M16 family metallopeptidase [Vulcanisaeta thermophila]|uniref:M16 family metallopeptidase n=1 Tax=Vulcanisaeta thermophila TaxID=867917 RepID=UPI000853B954|nr:pitrilysin family protein [Vulcanisaeta thermophila]
MVKLVQLDNGLRIIINEVRSLSTVGIAIAVNAGSAYEERDKRGLSHIIEHVIYRAYPNIDLVIEGLGGMSDAYTQRTLTMYLFEVIPGNVRGILRIISDMFSRRGINDDDLNKELRVVLSELKMRNDDPGTLIYDLGPRALFGEGDYGDPVIGYVDTVKSITRDDIEEYLNRYYTPDNMVMAIVGPVDISEEELNKYFGKWYGRVRAKLGFTMGNGGPIVIKRSIDSAYLSYSWYVDIAGNDYMGLIKSSLLEFHLTTGLSSYLISRLRDKGLSYAVDLDREYLNGIMFFQVVIQAVDPRDIDEVRKEVEQALRGVGGIGGDGDYVMRRRNYLRYVISESMRRPLDVAESMAYLGLKFNRYDLDALNNALEEHFTDDLSDLIRDGVWSMIIPSE